MSFDNHYPNRKDWRKPYRDSRQFDRGCRNHNGCGWCEGRRTFKNLRRMPADEAPRRNNRNPHHFWHYTVKMPL